MAGSLRDRAHKPSTRPRAFDDSDDDDAGLLASSSSRHEEEIVSFGRDGAKGRGASPVSDAPRVIPVTSNLDWRQDRKERLGRASNLQALGPLVSMRRAGASAVPGLASSSSTNDDINIDAINTEAQKRGLKLRSSKVTRADDTPQQLSGDVFDEQTADASAVPKASADVAGEDAEAIKALLAGQGNDSAGTGGQLIIHQETESELLQHDIDSRPEAPTLDDYAATPIDQFGMALLRGMGWKEGMGAGKGGKGPQQAAEPRKRAALLGLGAKERPTGPLNLSKPSSSSGNLQPKDKRDYKYVPVSKSDPRDYSNGRSPSSDHQPREKRPSKSHSTDLPSSHDSRRGDRDDRHARHSRTSHRQRSRSPTRSGVHDRDRRHERRRDGRDPERRSHPSSRSDRDRRSECDRDERRSSGHRR
ncbi:uncharacterized protein UMAG_03089 [Mycosarcoma maydis]|uniref:Pre-mRNA-splicing factor SPP2 n=1 Tax=Mycosarcoma maydis TaxID=5270 RepID=SPP2_MYCMD|nr:uncharacterized protein UMAG_03089 [Ustilago maydis 521]Q4P9X4.1 RecName: Full=Pre-mRNA-splicing factor SPP2 [Ustilago maydis 521]KIS69111.1 hypothetical protein UMAG_03089 [Ustilago maydis 521]|eukprot:XP_011389448.1 hypothetical protein UMAG_03089 [Ustilago maydis 521]